MMIPFQIIMIPLYLEEHYMGMLNTYAGLIIPHIATAYGIFFMKSFYTALPESRPELMVQMSFAFMAKWFSRLQNQLSLHILFSTSQDAGMTFCTH